MGLLQQPVDDSDVALAALGSIGPGRYQRPVALSRWTIACRAPQHLSPFPLADFRLYS